MGSGFRRNGGLSGEDGTAHDFGFVAGHEGGDFGYVVGVGQVGDLCLVVFSVTGFFELLTEVIEDERGADAAGGDVLDTYLCHVDVSLHDHCESVNRAFGCSVSV